jgi:hypothetical protein
VNASAIKRDSICLTGFHCKCNNNESEQIELIRSSVVAIAVDSHQLQIECETDAEQTVHGLPRQNFEATKTSEMSR